MTDLTTIPQNPDALATGLPSPDRRTQRKVTLAEQDRLTADADLDRRNRAALLDLELQERRAEVARRRREADEREKASHREARKARRAARRARLRSAVPVWADRALFTGPIIFPMAVAWVGQIQFARDVMGWPLAGALVFAAGFEMSTAYVARLDWKARADGDSTALFRLATWLFAGSAAAMNYWHAADPGFRPNGVAVSYGVMSLAGVILWELLSIFRHRAILRAEGKLPSRRPRFGAARRIWFPRVTHLAALLVLRDGHTTTEGAWSAALAQVAEYGTVKQAIAVLRGKQPALAETSVAEDGRDKTADRLDSADGDVETGGGEPLGRADRVARRDKTAAAGQAGRVARVKTASSRRASTESRRDDTSETAGVGDTEPEYQPGSGETPFPDTTSGDRRVGRRSSRRQRRGDGSPGEVKLKMITYARERIAAGETVTGADLDRVFGTTNYGARVLRQSRLIRS
jgi:hypothetical protein